MKLETTINGKRIELKDPGLVKHDGKWFESVALRIGNKGEIGMGLGTDKNLFPALNFLDQHGNPLPVWIMREIPRPTPDQLKAIGKVLDGDSPVECKTGDVVWSNGENLIGPFCHAVGKYRWHLKDAPQPTLAPVPVRASCSDCLHERNDGYDRGNTQCQHCFLWYDASAIRMNYTSAPGVFNSEVPDKPATPDPYREIVLRLAGCDPLDYYVVQKIRDDAKRLVDSEAKQ